MPAIMSLVCVDCGYNSGPMHLGSGGWTYKHILALPALCRACSTIIVDNYYLPADTCPGCGVAGELRFYNDPLLHQAPEHDPIATSMPWPQVPPSLGGGAWTPPRYASTMPEDAATLDRVAGLDTPVPEGYYEAAAARTPPPTDAADWSRWPVGRTGARFCMPDRHLLCPACGAFTLWLDLIGDWD